MADLDATLENVLFDVWLVSRATTALIDDAVAASGLDADEFAIYSVLVSGDGMTPTDLAHWMSAPATTVSSYVKRFEERGHVRRVENPEDRRSYRVQMTDEGRRVHRVAGQLFLPVLHQVTARMGSRVAGAHRSLQALRAAVDTFDDQD